MLCIARLEPDYTQLDRGNEPLPSFPSPIERLARLCSNRVRIIASDPPATVVVFIETESTI